MDDLITNNGETSSKTSSTENNQNYAQNSDPRRLDDQDDLFSPTNETSEEKYRREQEEIAKWDLIKRKDEI